MESRFRPIVLASVLLGAKFAVVGCGNGGGTGQPEPPRAANVDERGEPVDSEKSALKQN